MEKCGKCGYVRQPTDDAPNWQCPSCGVAYSKVSVQGASQAVHQKNRQESHEEPVVAEPAPKKSSTSTRSLDTEILLSELHPSIAPMNRQSLAVLGSVMMIVGVFSPLVSIPVLGNLTLFGNGTGVGSLVLLLGLYALFVSVKMDYSKLWYPIIGTLIISAYLTISYYIQQKEDKKQKQELISEMGEYSNLFSGIADGIQSMIQLQWGVGLILSGILLLTICLLQDSQ